jgi:hypothetical protein
MSAARVADMRNAEMFDRVLLLTFAVQIDVIRVCKNNKENAMNVVQTC